MLFALNLSCLPAWNWSYVPSWFDCFLCFAGANSNSCCTVGVFASTIEKMSFDIKNATFLFAQMGGSESSTQDVNARDVCLLCWKLIFIIWNLKVFIRIYSNYFWQDLFGHLWKVTQKLLNYFLDKKELMSILKMLICFHHCLFQSFCISKSLLEFLQIILHSTYLGIL